MIFKVLEEDATLSTNYIFQAPVIIFTNGVSEDDSKLIAEKLSDKIINAINENEKFINEALEINSFEVRFHEFKHSTLSIIMTLPIFVESNELKRVVGRYFNQEVTDEISGKKIRARVVREWLECSEYFEIL